MVLRSKTGHDLINRDGKTAILVDGQVRDLDEGHHSSATDRETNNFWLGTRSICPVVHIVVNHTRYRLFPATLVDANVTSPCRRAEENVD